MIGTLIERTVEIWAAILGNPLVYMPLIGNWMITALYFIVNDEERRGHTYVMSSGIAHLFTAYVISPFAKADMSWSFSDVRTLVVTILFAYGLLLVVTGILQKLPEYMTDFFGDPGHALVPGMMAILLVEESIPFDWWTAGILAVLPLIVGGISFYRRVKD